MCVWLDECPGTLYVKRDLCTSKKTYVCQKRSMYDKRDLCMTKETYAWQKRPMYDKRDLCMTKETYAWQKRPMYDLMSVPAHCMSHGHVQGHFRQHTSCNMRHASWVLASHAVFHSAHTSAHRIHIHIFSCTRALTHAHVQKTLEFPCERLHASALRSHARMHTLSRTHTRTHRYQTVYVYVYVYAYVYVYVYAYVYDRQDHIYTCICICIYMYMYMHMRMMDRTLAGEGVAPDGTGRK